MAREPVDCDAVRFGLRCAEDQLVRYRMVDAFLSIGDILQQAFCFRLQTPCACTEGVSLRNTIDKLVSGEVTPQEGDGTSIALYVKQLDHMRSRSS